MPNRNNYKIYIDIIVIYSYKVNEKRVETYSQKTHPRLAIFLRLLYYISIGLY